MQFYVDNLGATLITEVPGPRLPGEPARADAQHHQPHRRRRRASSTTASSTSPSTPTTIRRTLARLRANGVRILEELPPTNGRRVCFLEAPDGAQIEIIERV